MRYNVAQLIKGPAGAQRQYELEEDIRNLDEALEPVQPLVGSVVLMRTSQGILVTGRLRTTLRAACRRCLELCDMEVELDIQEEFYPSVPISGSPIDRVASEDYDDALLIDEHHILDLREVVRQALWLTAPEDALCRIDCAGLCPRCGGNRNLGECQCSQPEIDPRWATLQALLPDESDL